MVFHERILHIGQELLMKTSCSLILGSNQDGIRTKVLLLLKKMESHFPRSPLAF